MKTFEMKTAIHFGDNALERLESIPYQRVLIITDPFVVQSKMIDLITRPLEKAGKEYDIFHNVVPDAPVDKIADGVKKFLSYQPEAIVAVGGGSAIDSSKAIREFALKINHYSDVGLIAIPTTSGTGSEVTSFAVPIVASLLNFVLFFFSTKNMHRYNPKEVHRRREFKKAVAQSRVNPAAGGVTKHKCAICGRTEKDDPNLEFRFCSKCNGNYEYCQDHLFTHQHVK